MVAEVGDGFLRLVTKGAGQLVEIPAWRHGYTDGGRKSCRLATVGRGVAVGGDGADGEGPTVGDAGLSEGTGCAVVAEARVAAGVVGGEPSDGVAVAGS